MHEGQTEREMLEEQLAANREALLVLGPKRETVALAVARGEPGAAAELERLDALDEATRKSLDVIEAALRGLNRDEADAVRKEQSARRAAISARAEAAARARVKLANTLDAGLGQAASAIAALQSNA